MQYLERGALSMSLPAVGFRVPLGARVQENYHVSPLPILGYCFDVVSLGPRYLGKALSPRILHSTQYLVGLRWQCVRLVPSAEMAAVQYALEKGVEMVHE